jgi:hypothetical protein
VLQSEAEVKAMSDIVSTGRTPKTAAEYKDAIEELLAEMERLDARMKSDQAEIDRLKAETAAIKTETRALLAALGAAV